MLVESICDADSQLSPVNEGRSPGFNAVNDMLRRATKSVSHPLEESKH